MSRKRIFCKSEWHKAVGLEKKPKRLKLEKLDDGKFYCPVSHCESDGYFSKRGCRKHVYQRHGWFYFFENKPDVCDYFPEANTRNATLLLSKRKRSCTSNMPSFLKTCTISIAFTTWLCTPGGGGKDRNQAEQLCSKFLKFIKFCCDDVCSTWDVPKSVVEYCMGSVSLISDFVTTLQDDWHVGFSGVIGYMNALSHVLDFCRSTIIDSRKIPVFLASEVYLDRVKKCLSKQMKVEWNKVLSVDHLTSINCWATLEEMQQVIPFHAEKFTQIILNCSDSDSAVPAHSLSFSTAFVVSVLFLMVKASRPMSYIYLTVSMVKKLSDKGGIIDQTEFKTNSTYSFDSLPISENVLQILNGYIDCIRPRLNPTCDYVLLTRTGKQIKQLSDIFGRMVYLAIGKHIHPTRYRQIIETESASKLTTEEQEVLSKDQKHTSNVAKVHYQKVQSREIALKAQACMQKLIGNANPWNVTVIPGVEAPHREVILPTSSSRKNIANITKPLKISNEAKEGSVQFSIKDRECKTRKKKVAFSKQEDTFLQRGIQKYGAKWTSILSDSSFAFNPCRQTSTLYLRAKKLHLI